MAIETSVCARIGLLGNPSDGYFGRTIACAIRNFAATVRLEESDRLILKPHLTFDPSAFTSLGALRETALREGYYGGYRLVFAACKKLADFCIQNHIRLPEKNFSLEYDTTIPRQVGLAGSSGIITAVVVALRRFYGITDLQLPREIQPNLVLSVEEEELDIRAGLQDRVIQTYGGVVYMDFDKGLMDTRGYGEYESLDPASLPPLFLAYLSTPKDSGKAHSDVRARWHRGDAEVVEGMRTFAEYASEGKLALARGDYETFGRLMNRNFDLRLRLFGREVIGEDNMQMIAIARELGAPAKFSGSGGAVVGMWRDEEQIAQLEEAYARRGYSFVRVEVDPGERTPSS